MVLAIGRQRGIDLEARVASHLGGAADHGSAGAAADRRASRTTASDGRQRHDGDAPSSTRAIAATRATRRRGAALRRSQRLGELRRRVEPVGRMSWRARACSASATPAGTAGRSWVIGGAFAVRCWCTMLSAVGPVNGGCPASIS